MSTGDAPVVVLGGSISGLATALFLSRRGVPVHVVEQDAGLVGAPAGGEPGEEERRAPRSVTPQAAQSHAFVALARQVLLAEAPDVFGALLAAGVEPIQLAERLPPAVDDRSTRPDDDELVVLGSRRTTFESVLRRSALEAEITFEAGAKASGLVVDATGARPRVVGVGLEDGRRLDASLVVDTCGRRTPVPGWLGLVDDVEVDDTSSSCGISYHTRFFQLRPGATGGHLNRGYTAGSSFDRYSCLVFPGDLGAFSVTFGTLPEDRELRNLTTPEAFTAAVLSIPLLAAWVEGDRSLPTSDVRSMTGMDNRVRRVRSAGRPGLPGLVSVGDAAATSNPAHTRGTSLALHHARLLAEAVDRHGLLGADLAEAMAQVVQDELVPWVADSAEQDAARLSRWRPEGDAEPVDFGAPALGADRVANGEAYVAAQADRDVWQRFTRLQNLLEKPIGALDDPALVGDVRRVQAAGRSLPAAPAPDHDELVEVVARHRRERRTVAAPS
jgi:flavin-dependent dehydrogenase